MGLVAKLDRRRFLALGAGAAGALVLGCRVPGRGEAPGRVDVFVPNAYLAVATDGSVTVWVPEAEMGQGVLTSIAMLVAEELEADWERVRVEQAPVDPERFGRMSTGGSTSVRQAWVPLRRAGATAREMLVTAAAMRWGVDRGECRAEGGEVLHPASGRRLGYGELAEAASALPVPAEVPLKDPSRFRLLGRPVPRVDTPPKVRGEAIFAIDVRRPGMLHAVVARCPVFGGRAASWDDTAALRVPGVRRVVPVSTGLAVVADTTWAAIRGREALEVTWEEGEAAGWDDGRIAAHLEARARERGAVARSEGDGARGLGRPGRRIEAVYTVPFLAHAPMEPLSAVADVRDGSCELWVGSQSPSGLRTRVAELLGLPEDRVTVHETLLGGAFGRRSWHDFGLEAVEVSRAVGAPVRLTWTREDDMRHDLYRPVSRHEMAAVMAPDGTPVAWFHRLVAPSLSEQLWPGSVKDGLDRGAVDGAANLPYAIPHLHVEYVMANTPVPVMWWRSVYNSQNAFANEAFLDEIAAAGGLDAVTLRLRLLEGAPRLRRVVEIAADRAGWGRRLEPGVGLGIACHESFGSCVAQVAEVEVDGTGRVRVRRVVCVVDCGPVVNPDTVKAQMEGGIVYGLSAALRGRISIRGGAVVEGNWDTYEPLRMREMPVVKTHIVPSEGPVGGVGEPGLPPIAPAVVNAVAAATARRVRHLPLHGQHGLRA